MLFSCITCGTCRGYQTLSSTSVVAVKPEHITSPAATDRLLAYGSDSLNRTVVSASSYSYNVIILPVLTLFSIGHTFGLIARLSNRWAPRLRSSPSLIRPLVVPREITTSLEKPLTFSAARTCRLIDPLTILAHPQICQHPSTLLSSVPLARTAPLVLISTSYGIINCRYV